MSINDYPSHSGPDGDSFLFVRIQPQTAGDLVLASLSGAFPPRELLATPAYEGAPQMSPDGRWLLYQSSASGRPEVYVRRYPEMGRAFQISEGGGQTTWSADGREIYYRSGERMMAASVDGAGDEPRLGRPVALFVDDYDLGPCLSTANYDA